MSSKFNGSGAALSQRAAAKEHFFWFLPVTAGWDSLALPTRCHGAAALTVKRYSLLTSIPDLLEKPRLFTERRVGVRRQIVSATLKRHSVILPMQSSHLVI